MPSTVQFEWHKISRQSRQRSKNVFSTSDWWFVIWFMMIYDNHCDLLFDVWWFLMIYDDLCIFSNIQQDLWRDFKCPSKAPWIKTGQFRDFFWWFQRCRTMATLISSGSVHKQSKTSEKNNYFTSSDPHRDIILKHICHKFWHSLC